MSAGESAVLRSSKPHVGKENSMLPPLSSPSRVLSLSRGSKYDSQKGSNPRRSNSDGETKIHKATSPMPPDKTIPNQQRRIQQLEKSILFMKEHHDKIVFALHEEIDVLKRKNRELNFRLVMSPASLPAHLLSPEEEEAAATGDASPSPRHSAGSNRSSAATASAFVSAEELPSAYGHQLPAAAAGQQPVQLELLQGELVQLADQLRLERARSEQLAVQLREAQMESTLESSAGEVAALEERLSAAEANVRQLKKERDDYQREVQRMRGSVQFRPPWRAGGGQRAAGAAPATGAAASRPAATGRTGNNATGRAGTNGTATAVRTAANGASQQQLPRIGGAGANAATHRPETRGSTAPPRKLDSRTASSDSLPALPRARTRHGPPPPPPPRNAKQ